MRARWFLLGFCLLVSAAGAENPNLATVEAKVDGSKVRVHLNVPRDYLPACQEEPNSFEKRLSGAVVLLSNGKPARTVSVDGPATDSPDSHTDLHVHYEWEHKPEEVLFIYNLFEAEPAAKDDC